jgi:hypothetical protein
MLVLEEHVKSNKTIEEETIEDIYCPVCGACGEDGCCDTLDAIEQHIGCETECLHADIYWKNLNFFVKLGRELFNEFSEDKRAKEIFDKLWNEIYLDKDSS